MAGGMASDFTVNNPYFQMGLFEKVSQNITAFNAPSSNCLRLIARKLEGNFATDSIFSEISDVDTRRDITSIAAVEDLKMAQVDITSVKLNRKVGPVSQTLDAWKKIGKSIDQMSYILGQQAGDEIIKSYLHRTLIATETCIESIGATAHYDGTGADISYSVLNTGNKLFGDASSKIKTYIMHSKPWHDLVADGIEETVNDVATYSIKEGKTYSLNRNVVVVDDTALVNEDGVSSGVDSYYTLGLVENAGTAEQSEDTTQTMTMVDNLENIMWRFRVEYAFNVAVKGFKYVEASGINPTDAYLGTTAYWDQSVTSIKNGPGIIIETA